MTAYLFKEEKDWWDRIRIDEEEFTIGRLAGNNLKLQDEKVSRRHCRISRRNGSYILEDLNSSNGTMVNRSGVSSRELSEGDIIRLGDTRLYFSERDRPPEESGEILIDLDHEKSQIKTVDDLSTSVIPAGAKGEDESTPSLSDERTLPEGEDRESEERNKFFLLYQLGKALNDKLGLKGVLRTAIDSIVDVLEPARCVIMTIPSDGKELQPELGWVSGDGFVSGDNIRLSTTIVQRAVDEKAAIISTDATSDPRFGGEGSVIDYNIDSVMCVPLWDQDSVTGAIWVDSGRGHSDFVEEDLDLLSAIANQVALRIKQEQIFNDLKQEAIMRKNLERFHSPDVVEEISRTSREGNEISQELKESENSILFIDIERFSKMAEKMPPREIASLLSGFYESVSQIVFDHHGGISKYIGDKVMAVFGAPVEMEYHAKHAVRAGKNMILKLQDLNRELSDEFELKVRVGINSGTVVHGYVGSSQVKEFTVLGDPVNVAARLEEIADPNEVLVGRRTRELIEGDIELEPIGSVPLEGRKEQMDVFRAPMRYDVPTTAETT